MSDNPKSPIAEFEAEYRAEAPSASPFVRRTNAVLGTLLAVIGILFAAGVQYWLGIAVFTQQVLAAMLATALALIFVARPIRRNASRDSVPWYDLAFAAAAFAAGIYLAIRYPVLMDQFFYQRTEAFIVGLVLVPLTIEGLRRVAGMGLTCIVLAFVLYALFGNIVPGMLQARTQSFFDLLSFTAVDPVAMFGLPMTIVCTIVIVYVFFGQLLLKTGGSTWFTEIATALMGGTRGGAAKISVVASGLFGSISGSAVANVVSTGVITIPLMRKAGYDAKTAGALEAVASTGGQIMPPIMGAAAFLMAEILQVPYTDVLIAAIVPALLYYIAVFVYADLEAARKGIVALPADTIPRLARVLVEGWYFIVPFAVLIWALFWHNRSPEEAALWAAAVLLVVNWIFGYKGKRLGIRDILDSVRETGLMSIDIVAIGAMAGIIIGIISLTGFGDGLTIVMVQFGEGNLPALLFVTAVLCIVLGMGMPTTAVYLLVAVLAAPPLIQVGIDPIAAHMFVLYFGIVSLITPPVAVASFVAASMARAGAMETAVTAVKLGWTALVVPVMFVMSPNLIMQGTVLDAGLAFVTAVAGVWIVTIAILGYFVRPTGAFIRFGFLVAGIALLIPAQAFEGAETIEIAGVGLAALLIAYEFYFARRARRLAA